MSHAVEHGRTPWRCHASCSHAGTDFEPVEVTVDAGGLPVALSVATGRGRAAVDLRVPAFAGFHYELRTSGRGLRLDGEAATVCAPALRRP